MGDFFRLNSLVSNMFHAGMRTTRAQQLVSIVWSVFDQKCLTVWTLTSTSACSVTKQCLMVFSRNISVPFVQGPKVTRPLPNISSIGSKMALHVRF